jgi:hypothetical protein
MELNSKSLKIKFYDYRRNRVICNAVLSLGSEKRLDFQQDEKQEDIELIKTIRNFKKYSSKSNGLGVDYLFMQVLKQVPSCEFTRYNPYKLT